MRGRDQLLRARLPARRLLRPRRPADVERPEGARADLVDRSRPAHQVAVPRHRCPALSSHVRSPPSSTASSARTLTEALARISAENGQPSSAARAACSSPACVDPFGPRRALELRGDDQVALPLDLVHRDRAGDVEPLDRAAGPRDLARERRRRSSRACAAASSSSGLVFPGCRRSATGRSIGSSNAPDASPSPRLSRARATPPTPPSACADDPRHLGHDLDLALLGGDAALTAEHLLERTDRDFDLVERRLARRQPLQPEARARAASSGSRLSWCLPAKRISS